jgi:serine/threonine-protein kinase RsbW
MKEGFTIIEQVKLPSDFASLVEVENLIDKVCADLGVQEDAYGNVLIAVTEAVNNAIQHGNEENSNLFVDVAVGDKETEFCFRIKD